MTLKEKKRKLSEILGINLFETRYKEIDELLIEQEESSPGNENENMPEESLEQDSEEALETDTEESEENNSDSSVNQENSEIPPTDGESASDEAVNAESGEDVLEEREEKEETLNSENNCGSNSENKSFNDELFDAKLEAKLLRLNVREDKLEPAKKLFKVDHTIADIEKADKFIKDYPEWIKQKVSVETKGFGMDVGNGDDGETPEEKRLRELGITK